MRILLAALMAAAAALTTGCGPEQTARDAERNEVDSMIAEQKAQFDGLEGRYEGTITTLDGKKLGASLNLHSFVSFTPVAGRAELIGIPSMVGFLTAGEGGNLNWAFNQGTYMPKDKVLKMLGQASTTAYLNFLNVSVVGNRLTGTFMAGKLTSNIELTKAK